MPGFLSALAQLLGFEPGPGTPEHRDSLHRSMRERNEELAKPAEQRDAERLLELTKRVLRLRIDEAQGRAQLLRSKADLVTRSQNLGCCSDCVHVRVRLRVAASLNATAVWHEEWVVISTLRLEALEQGHPYPPLTLPHLEVQPHLAEGIPEELPPSIDRCAACQTELDEHLYREQNLLVQVDYDP